VIGQRWQSAPVKRGVCSAGIYRGADAAAHHIRVIGGNRDFTNMMKDISTPLYIVPDTLPKPFAVA
jgi:hypothetical protein